MSEAMTAKLRDEMARMLPPLSEYGLKRDMARALAACQLGGSRSVAPVSAPLTRDSFEMRDASKARLVKQEV